MLLVLLHYMSLDGDLFFSFSFPFKKSIAISTHFLSSSTSTTTTTTTTSFFSLIFSLSFIPGLLQLVLVAVMVLPFPFPFYDDNWQEGARERERESESEQGSPALLHHCYYQLPTTNMISPLSLSPVPFYYFPLTPVFSSYFFLFR